MPDWIYLFAVSFGSLVVVLVTFVFARRFHKPIDVGTEQSFLDAMLTIVGTLVSILLGLLVAASLDRYQKLEDAVDSESRAVSDVFRLARGLPDDPREKLQDTCLRYCDLVVNNEWPLLDKNTASVELFELYGQLLDGVLTFDPKGERQTSIQQAIMSAVLEMGDYRRARLLAINCDWINLLAPVLIFSAATVLIFAYLYMKAGSKLHLLLVSVVTLCLASNVGLIWTLNSPFNGPMKIKPRSFIFNIELLTKILHKEPKKQIIHSGQTMPIAP